MPFYAAGTDRRKQRSHFVDQALERFLSVVRKDNGLDALILSDASGHLIATSAEGFSLESLRALGTFGVGLRDRPAENGRSSDARVSTTHTGEQALVHTFNLGVEELTLTMVGKQLLQGEQLERTRAGIRRILVAPHAP